MAQQTHLLTLATFSVGVGLRSVNRKLRSLCAAQPRVGCLISFPSSSKPFPSSSSSTSLCRNHCHRCASSAQWFSAFRLGISIFSVFIYIFMLICL